MSPRLGIAFVPSLEPESLPAVARAADAHLDELWVWEDCFKQSGLASAVAALACTERITVGLGLMPAPLRNPALAAMEIATVHRMFPGRFLPGLGHGIQSWMGQAGARVSSPMTLLEEYATAVRRLLDGETVTSRGRYVTLDAVELAWPPAPGTPLAMGGMGPRTLALAGRLGDRLLLSAALSPADLAAAREAALAPWRQRHGDEPLPVVHSLVVVTGEHARERAVAEMGIWQTGVEDDRCAIGDAVEVAAVIDRCARAGATTVVIQPALDESDVAGLIRFVGEDVRPLLS